MTRYKNIFAVFKKHGLPKDYADFLLKAKPLNPRSCKDVERWVAHWQTGGHIEGSGRWLDSDRGPCDEGALINDLCKFYGV